jgi:hypothetical protein
MAISEFYLTMLPLQQLLPRLMLPLLCWHHY